MFSLELTCRRCGWRTLCGAEAATARLRLIGLLRREKDPDDAVLEELLVEAAPRMTCPSCKHKGTLQATASDQLAAEGDDWGAEWQAAIHCEVCREPIPPERVEALPGTKRCVDCQDKTESGRLVEEEREYCPKCGALVELRVSRGTGITRYKRFCTNAPPCRMR